LTEPRDAAVALEVYVWFEADPADVSQVLAAFGRLGEAMASGARKKKLAISDKP
jgi:hypothetical protein